MPLQRAAFTKAAGRRLEADGKVAPRLQRRPQPLNTEIRMVTTRGHRELSPPDGGHFRGGRAGDVGDRVGGRPSWCSIYSSPLLLLRMKVLAVPAEETKCTGALPTPARAQRHGSRSWRLRYRGGRRHSYGYSRAGEPGLQRVPGSGRLHAARTGFSPGAALGIQGLLSLQAARRTTPPLPPVAVSAVRG